MFSSNKRLKWTELRELTSGWIGFVGNYVNFITEIRPDLKNRKLVLELRSLEKKLLTQQVHF